MTDQEFDVLDELYFVRSFAALAEDTDYKGETLLNILMNLYRKGWINCYSTPTDEIPMKKADIEKFGEQYYYLANKAGLLHHNS